jgi:hypothetical protein
MGSGSPIIQAYSRYDYRSALGLGAYNPAHPEPRHESISSKYLQIATKIRF